MACDQFGTGPDSIFCLYDNNETVADGYINYSLYYCVDFSCWQVLENFTSGQGILRTSLTTHLIAPGDFNEDGYEDVAIFYRIPTAAALNKRGKILISDGYELEAFHTKWDAKT